MMLNRMFAAQCANDNTAGKAIESAGTTLYYMIHKTLL